MAAALGTVLVSYGLVVPVAGGLVLSGGGQTSLDGAFATAMPLWLVAHHIPLVLHGQPLSVLPLLPVAGIVAITASAGRWALARIGGRVRIEGGAVVASIAGAHAAVAVLGSALLPPGAQVAVDPWAAMVGGGLVAGVGAALGVLRVRGGLRALSSPWIRRVPRWFWVARRGAAVALLGLSLFGWLILFTALVVRANEVAEAFRSLAPNAGAGVGVTLLALAYLPNAVIGGMSWALGPGVTVGAALASPFASAPGAATSFPLLAALPPTVPASAPLVLLGPVTVGLIAGLVVRRLSVIEQADHVRAAVAAVVLTAAGVGVLAHLAGGRLANGPFDPIRVPVEFVVPAAVLWIGVPLFLTVVLRRGVLDGLYEDDEEPSEEPTGRDGTPRPRTVAELVALRERQKQAAKGAEKQ